MKKLYSPNEAPEHEVAPALINEQTALEKEELPRLSEKEAQVSVEAEINQNPQETGSESGKEDSFDALFLDILS